jgi:hypothetical protein
VEANPAAKAVLQMESIPNAVETRTGFRLSKTWIFAAVLLLVIAAEGTFLFAHRGKKVLTERDTVVLADFDNSTGEPVFDGTLRQGMAVQLEQSPFLLSAHFRIASRAGQSDCPQSVRLLLDSWQHLRINGSHNLSGGMGIPPC